MRGVPFSSELREATVKRMLGDNAPSIPTVALNTGINKTTLYNWRRQARQQAMTDQPPSSPHRRTPQEKWRLVRLAEGLEGEELGSFLRREGLHLADLDAWRASILQVLQQPDPPAHNTTHDSRQTKALKTELKGLQAELRRKDAALAEAAALLILSKKAHRLWGGEDDSTVGKSDNKSSK